MLLRQAACWALLAGLTVTCAQEGVLVLDYNFDRTAASALRATPFSFGASSYTIEGECLGLYCEKLNLAFIRMLQVGIFSRLALRLELSGILEMNSRATVSFFPLSFPILSIKRASQFL